MIADFLELIIKSGDRLTNRYIFEVQYITDIARPGRMCNIVI